LEEEEKKVEMKLEEEKAPILSEVRVPLQSEEVKIEEEATENVEEPDVALQEEELVKKV
jgi:hypothetical protein